MTEYQKIASDESLESNYPWYVVEINDKIPEITEDKDGGTEFDMGGMKPSVPSFVDLPDPAQAAMQKDAVYAVTEKGEFIAYGQGTNLAEHGISLRAHLAWYDSAVDEFTVLELVES